MKNILKTSVLSLFVLLGVAFAAPHKAHALFLDSLFENAPNGPHCLMMDCGSNNNNNSQPSTVNNYTNSGNVNSFNNTTSVGTNYGSVTAPYSVAGSSGTSANTPYGSASGAWGASASAVSVATTPFAPSAPAPVANANTNVNYNYNSNGGGTTYVPTPVYSSPSYGYYAPTPVYTYPGTPTTPWNIPQYQSLTGSCTANTTYAQVGSYITWSAYPSGGNYGGYTYRWSGTDGIYGSQNQISTYYSTPGVKTAWVTIYSNGQSVTIQCSSSVSVQGQQYYQQPISYNYNSGLQVACAADTTSTKPGIAVTWNAEATGSGYNGGYNYSWSGSEGLYGSQSSIVTKYSTTGTKSATVTVTSPDGQSATRTCSNTVYVKSATIAKAPVKQAPQVVVTQPEVSAAALFSLDNVPWGWVAILIILILIGVVLYLAFNQKKI